MRPRETGNDLLRPRAVPSSYVVESRVGNPVSRAGYKGLGDKDVCSVSGKLDAMLAGQVSLQSIPSNVEGLCLSVKKVDVFGFVQVNPHSKGVDEVSAGAESTQLKKKGP
ncbi:hypothetical protein LWI28_005400 [Acer negundo]|uniref:Uncharacterized protein n=1 Tax=Acer negundo TaxID=4023 RepID=A0AAD5IXN3_ACENE|nr:hypothetical protein LWI28_005400 [Acer negundo]